MDLKRVFQHILDDTSEGLVAVCANRHITAFARVVVREITLEFTDIGISTFAVHGTGIECALGTDDQEPMSRAASGHTIHAEELVDSLQHRPGIHDMAGFALHGNQFVYLLLQRVQICLVRYEELVIAGPHLRIRAVGNIYSPFLAAFGDIHEASNIGAGDGAVHRHISKTMRRQPRNQLGKMIVETGYPPEIVMALVGKIKGDGHAVDTSLLELQILRFSEKPGIADQNDQGGGILCRRQSAQYQ